MSGIISISIAMPPCFNSVESRDVKSRDQKNVLVSKQNSKKKKDGFWNSLSDKSNSNKKNKGFWSSATTMGASQS